MQGSYAFDVTVLLHFGEGPEVHVNKNVMNSSYYVYKTVLVDSAQEGAESERRPVDWGSGSSPDNLKVSATPVAAVGAGRKRRTQK